MAQAYTKYHPDPSKPITREHFNLLQQWGLWAKAKARGVKVLKETDEASVASDENGPKTDPQGKAQPDPEKAVTEPPADEDEEVPYSEWTVEELREELEIRKLPKGGNKDELIAKLEKDDAKK